MDKKAWLVVILCAAGMIYLYPAMVENMTPKPKPPSESGGVSEGDAEGTGAEGSEAAGGGGVKPGAADGPVSTEVEEKLVNLDTPKARFILTSAGGGIAKVELLDHTRTREDGGLVVINEDDREPIGALGVGVGEFSDAQYRVISKSGGEVVFEGVTSEGLKVRKRHRLGAEGTDEYLINLDLTIKNETANDYRRSDLFLFAGAAMPLHPAEWPQQTGFFWRDESKMRFKNVSWFAPSKFIVQFSEGHDSLEETVEELHWAGVMNQFFATVVTNRTPENGQVWAKRFPVKLDGYKQKGKAKPLYAIEGGLGLPDMNLKPGDQISLAYDIYTGPKEYQRLRGLGDHRTEVMNYGGMPLVGIVSAPVSRLLVQVLAWLYGLVGSYGVAIILMTLMIRTLIWPLHAKSTRTMKRMALLGPKMKELKEKHADDPQKLNQETMRMYKEYGVNPFGGCLPVFFQLPIFLGFYRMLQSAVELRHQHFLWVEDLSMPDTLFTIPIFGGFPFNLMPLLMGGTMLLQMKFTPKTGDKMQQRMFMFMPLIFLFFCYNFAAALALYWTTQNIFSIGQTWYMGRTDPPTLEKKKAKPSLMEKAQSRTKVAGQGPSQTKSRKKSRKK
jgi:YidC/Oxa1 family membrane protein insertase